MVGRRAVVDIIIKLDCLSMACGIRVAVCVCVMVGGLGVAFGYIFMG